MQLFAERHVCLVVCLATAVVVCQGAQKSEVKEVLEYQDLSLDGLFTEGGGDGGYGEIEHGAGYGGDSGGGYEGGHDAHLSGGGNGGGYGGGNDAHNGGGGNGGGYGGGYDTHLSGGGTGGGYGGGHDAHHGGGGYGGGHDAHHGGGGVGGGYGGGNGGGHQYDHKPAKYAFQYIVEDPHYGGNYGHQEQRDGHETQGSYYVHLPDGRIQTVKYTADHHGYHPVVTYEGKASYGPPSGGYKGDSASTGAGYHGPHTGYGH